MLIRLRLLNSEYPVQTITPLEWDGALRLTTALYYLPSGRSIQARGITPDIRVSQMRMSPSDSAGTQIREQDLDNHFQSPAEPTQQNMKAGSGDLQEEVTDDYQLQRALDLLKGIEILKKTPKAA